MYIVNKTGILYLVYPHVSYIETYTRNTLLTPWNLFTDYTTGRIPEVHVPMVQKVQKSIEVPQLQYEDQVVEVPVTKQVHVPLVETVQKSVEVPQVQYEDQVVHVPVQKQVHVPMVQTVQKSIDVPQVQYEDEIVEVRESFALRWVLYGFIDVSLNEFLERCEC